MEEWKGEENPTVEDNSRHKLGSSRVFPWMEGFLSMAYDFLPFHCSPKCSFSLTTRDSQEKDEGQHLGLQREREGEKVICGIALLNLTHSAQVPGQSNPRATIITITTAWIQNTYSILTHKKHSFLLTSYYHEIICWRQGYNTVLKPGTCLCLGSRFFSFFFLCTFF